MLVNDMPHRLLSNSDILSRYLQKEGPPLAQSADIKYLDQQLCLSVVASHEQEIFKNYGIFDDWPHAQGQLRLNPHYVEDGRDEFGRIHLRRTFSSLLYEEGHAECKDYLPERITVDSSTLTDIEDGRRTPEVEDLIRQVVVLGMPKKYY